MRIGGRGFTLVEVLVTLAILGVTTTLVFSGFQTVILPRRAQNGARELGSMLRAAQQMATANAGGYRCVGVVLGTAGVEVTSIGLDDMSVDCNNPSLGSFSGTVALRSETTRTGVAVTVSTGGQTGIVSFLPTGAPCAGANCARFFVFTGGASSRRVCIAQGTGLIQIVEAMVCP